MKTAGVCCVALLAALVIVANADIFTDAAGGHQQAVLNAIDNGADANLRNEVGMTALHVAAQNGHVKLVSALLSRGADPDILDQNRGTAYYYANLGNHTETAEILRKATKVPCSDALVICDSDRKPLLEQNQIEWFNWQKQEFRLKPEAKRILPPKMLTEEFELWLKGRLVYKGWMISPLSSWIPPGIIIRASDITGSVYEIGQLMQDGNAQDSPYDLALWKHLKEAGLLQETKPPLDKWKANASCVVHAVVLQVPQSFKMPPDLPFIHAQRYRLRVITPYKGSLKAGDEFDVFVDTFGLQQVSGNPPGSELIVFADRASWKKVEPAVLVAHDNGRAYLPFTKKTASKL